MIAYPTLLPRPSTDYSLAVENSSVRSRMDSGRIRQRRRFTESQNQVSVKWNFTDDEYQLFESFVYHALSGGNEWFEADIVSGGGVETHKVRIQEGKYKATYRGFMNWVVTATLDVESINRLTESQLVYKLYPIEELNLYLEYCVNVQIPAIGDYS